MFTIYRYLIIPLLLWFRYLLRIEILNCPTIRFPPQFNSVCHNAKGGEEEEEPSVTAVCIPVNVFRHKWSISRFFHLSNVTCILSTVTLLQPEELFFLLQFHRPRDMLKRNRMTLLYHSSHFAGQADKGGSKVTFRISSSKDRQNEYPLYPGKFKYFFVERFDTCLSFNSSSAARTTVLESFYRTNHTHSSFLFSLVTHSFTSSLTAHYYPRDPKC